MADLEAFYGRPPDRTVRAIVGVVDGEIVGVGGVAYEGRVRGAFCDLRPEAKRHKIALHKAALRVLAMAQETGVPQLVAVCTGDEPGAPRWLKRLGFRHVGSSSEGEVFVWGN